MHESTTNPAVLAKDGSLDLDESVFYFRDLHLQVPSHTFFFEGGLSSLVKFTNQILKPVHKNIFYVEKQVEGVESVEIALQYADDITSRILAVCKQYL
jgi:DNA gyrase/topoisomerase IV subunit B